jgi:hypothetical protein
LKIKPLKEKLLLGESIMKQLDSRAGERGAVSIKTLLTFAAIGIILFVAIKMIPVYAEQRQVIFDVDEMAQKASIRNLKEADVKKAIEALCTKYDLPEGSIKLDSFVENKVQISLGYNRVIDLLVTSYNWPVTYVATGKAI